MPLELVSSSKCFNGFQKVYKHFSSELNCSMNFSLYEPHNPDKKKLNVLFYLSGLTCTEQNFIQKSGFQRYASEKQFIVVGPDTSPRDCNLPGDKDNWDFGEGAGCYLDALMEPWHKHYRMYSYVSKELPALIKSNFPTAQFGIFGHSMGGHGALVIGLRNPDLFKSISAFAPISNPTKTKWGQEVSFKRYLGDENKDKWASYDSTELIKSYKGPKREILVDQGLDDEFLTSHLMPKSLEDASSKNADKIKLQLRLHEGYNHSYFFVQSFIADHINFHANVLGSGAP